MEQCGRVCSLNQALRCLGSVSGIGSRRRWEPDDNIGEALGDLKQKAQRIGKAAQGQGGAAPGGDREEEDSSDVLSSR